MSQPKETLAQKLMANQKANEECARIITEDPKSGGIMLEWANAILAHAEEGKKDATGERGK